MAEIDDKIAAARKAGYSDQQIYEFLKGHKTYGGMFDKAKSSGFTESDVLGRLKLNVKEAPVGDPAKRTDAPLQEWGHGQQIADAATFGHLPQIKALGEVSKGMPSYEQTRMAASTPGVPQAPAPEVLKERYNTAVQGEQNARGAFEQENPGMSTAENMLGSAVPLGLGVGGANVVLGNILERVPYAGNAMRHLLQGTGGWNAAGRAPGAMNWMARQATRASSGGIQAVEGDLLDRVMKGGEGLTAEEAQNDAGLGAALNLALGTARRVGKGTVGLMTPVAKDVEAMLARRAGAPIQLDTREIVPGSRPTLAEAAGNPAISEAQRFASRGTPEMVNSIEELANAKNAARQQHLAGATGTDQDIRNIQMQLDNITPDTVLRPGQNVNLGEVTAYLDQLEQGSSMANPAAQSLIRRVRGIVDGLTTQQVAGTTPGAMVTIPRTASTMEAYESLHKGLRDIINGLDPNVQRGSDAMRWAHDLRDRTTRAIDQGADPTGNTFPFSDQYATPYRQGKERMEAMQLLQGLNLVERDGSISPAKFSRAMTALREQASAKGANPAKSLSPRQWDTLNTLEEDLLRSENATASRGMDPWRNEHRVTGLRGAAVLDLLGGAAGGWVGAHTGISPLLTAPAGAALAQGAHGALALRQRARDNALRDIIRDPTQLNISRLNRHFQEAEPPMFSVPGAVAPQFASGGEVEGGLPADQWKELLDAIRGLSAAGKYRYNLPLSAGGTSQAPRRLVPQGMDAILQQLMQQRQRQMKGLPSLIPQDQKVVD